MSEHFEVLKRLRKEEGARKDQKLEVALASTVKKGGEATLSIGLPKNKYKAGTHFPLPNGCEIVCRSGDKYKIETTITENVFLVRSMRTVKLYAMKIEWLKEEKGPKQMLRDVRLLVDAGKHEPRFSRHFPRMLNKGRVAKAFNFLVMTLGNVNLNDLRVIVMKNSDFTRHDAGRLSLQTFQAVHDLHTLGYLHRNISPSKFVLGIDNRQIVYLIGFSRSHHFEQHYGNKPRGSPRRLPNVSHRTFLPRNYHRNKDIQRRDDLESWIYLCFNLFGRQLLPWNEAFTDANMLVNKERLFCDGFEQCYKYVPRQFLTIMHNLDKYDEKARPDYTFIGMTLVSVKESIKFHFTGPFDFQKKPGKKQATIDEQEKEKQEKKAALAVAEAKDEARSPAVGSFKSAKSKKKAGGFKDDEEPDSSDNSERTKKNTVSPGLSTRAKKLRRDKDDLAAKLAATKEKEEINRERREKEDLENKLATIEDEKAQAEIDRALKEKEELAAKLAAAKSGQNEAELERIRREKKELEAALLAATDEGKSQEERDRIRREKEEMLEKLKTMETDEQQAQIERERKEKEELAAKIAATRAEQAKAQLERERKEKEELEAKLAEIEAQKKRDEEAAAAAAEAAKNKPGSPPKAEAEPEADDAKFNKSFYLTPYSNPDQP